MTAGQKVDLKGRRSADQMVDLKVDSLELTLADRLVG